MSFPLQHAAYIVGEVHGMASVTRSQPSRARQDSRRDLSAHVGMAGEAKTGQVSACDLALRERSGQGTLLVAFQRAGPVQIGTGCAEVSPLR